MGAGVQVDVGVGVQVDVGVAVGGIGVELAVVVDVGRGVLV
jgi:hypothetical protein